MNTFHFFRPFKEHISTFDDIFGSTHIKQYALVPSQYLKTHKVWIWTVICLSFHQECAYMFCNQKLSNEIHRAFYQSMLLVGFLNQEL